MTVLAKEVMLSDSTKWDYARVYSVGHAGVLETLGMDRQVGH